MKIETTSNLSVIEISQYILLLNKLSLHNARKKLMKKRNKLYCLFKKKGK